MTLAQIIDGLSQRPVADENAERMARQAFLHWLLSQPAGTDMRQAAGAALRRLPAQPCLSLAQELFRDCLRDAARAAFMRPVRRGCPRVRRRLH
ncbi:hypothetical protein DDZ14_02605 [Maritimibacter sp. 55A14]|uniref:hypothetical protein n=1 Tax=Maritimibacter sp. 55A14 TaxID=2174844 RepID=UPI000D608ED6|nr:hypothetical protein [Maritimibacter sp. 55A14]PWE34072.1 hypothetical protein DDZ14_02605 [Maritimibacter sp. 55A14]